MKTTLSVFLLSCAAVLPSSAQPLQTDTSASSTPVSSAAAFAAIPATEDGYSVTDVGANHRRWSRVTAFQDARGKFGYITNSYVELQDNMYYVRQGANGPEWAECKAEIEAFPGGAVARQGPIQMIFANDLATSGAIDVQTPAGRFRSHVLGLCYADSAVKTNIWIAEAKSCQGNIIASNQVLYAGALVGDGFSAGVRYTYRTSGWEQDIIIMDPASLIAPEAYGLDSSSPTLTLQVITEFLDPPIPAQTSRTIATPEGATFQDEDVDWGPMKLEHGKAFFLGQDPDAKGIPVNKRWIEVNSRHLLVEELPFSSLLKVLLSKHPGASLKLGDKSNGHLASLKSLPVLPQVKSDSKPMEVAAAPPLEATFLIDYYTTLASTASNYVFATDTTYYVPGTSGAVNLNGVTTLEGGCVIKFASTTSAKLLVNGPLVCQTGPYRMAVLTSKHDTSVGQAISGASGNPTNTGAIYIDAAASQTNAYSYLRVAYAGTGLRGPNFTNGVWHSQFVQCGKAVESTASNPVALRNVLLARCTNGVVTTGSFAGEHLTVDQCSTLLSGAGSSGNLTNCILTGVTNLGTINLYATPRLSTSNGVYQTVGAANYYLVNSSTNRQAGVTNINPTLLKALRSRTTCPPLVMDSSNITATTTWSPLAQRITGTPDRGFAYDPLDYLCRQITVTGQTLILTNGVAVGFFGAIGIDLSGGNSTIIGQGRPEAMNRLVWYPAVQEQSIRLNNVSTVDSLLFNTGYATTPKTIQLRFTELAMHGARQSLWSQPAYPYHQTTLSLRDCWLHALNITEAGFAYPPASTLNWTFQNNLVERSTLSLFNGWVNISSDPDYLIYVANPLAASLCNNLFRRSTVSLTYKDWGMTNHPAWAVKDNLFDYTTLSFTGDGNYLTYVTRANNGFYNTSTGQLQGTSNVVLTNLSYVTGALGPWYIGSASPTVTDAGSQLAIDAGLFHFTTTSNQVPEGATIVDVGFHYVAVDLNTGQPYDWDRDGIPDYMNGTGSALDWWLIQYFGRTDIDPYALCSSGDGWTILQAYQNGWNPTNFYTPPPPQNVAAVLDSTGTNAIITWTSGGGPVTNYAIWFGSWTTNVNTNTFSFTYHGLIPGDISMDWPITVRAYFANGAYADSQAVYVWTSGLGSSMAAVRGPGGQLYLVVGAMPANLSSVRVYWQVWDPGVRADVYHSIDLSAAAFTNGAAPLPLDQMTGYAAGAWFDAQCICSNSSHSAVAELLPYPFSNGDAGLSGYTVLSYVDARPHLKENLKFLLRSATVTQPFTYLSGIATPFAVGSPSVDLPEEWYARPASPTNYEYSGYHTFSPNLNFSFLEEARPVRENFLWSNFVFNPSNYGQTGASFQDDCSPATFLRTLDYPLYVYPGSGTEANPALALVNANAQWLFFRLIHPGSDCGFSQEVGIGTNSNNKFLLNSGVNNFYGLSLIQAKLDLAGLPVLLPGFASAFSVQDATCYPQTAIPGLQTSGYYFASQTPYLNGEYEFWPGDGPLGGPAPPLPGSPTFSVTNTSPLLIIGFGQPITVSGWAKLAITNGYSGKYAYLEQYFTNAYTIDASGNLTTNSAGVLSPYGEFFPMQPGPAALITMPDLDTGQRGTGVVNVIKLQTDVDHNGIMDLSFGGPDTTSQVRPLLVWVNNDYDYSGASWDLGHDAEASWYFNDGYQGKMDSLRDLEDYARLWVCGLPALTNGNYQVTLSWANVSSGSPTINLFNTVETNGGIGYLTNLATATAEAYNYGVWGECRRAIATISPGQSFTFPASYFTNAGNKYFLFDGVTNGAGELLLTISQNTTNVIAQTGAWMDLRDIKDFIEQARITNVVTTFPAMRDSTNTSAFTIDHYATVPPADDDKRIIVLVHGWNNGIWQSENYAETMFKRLWWQGYRGRFVALRWPTLSGETDPWTSLLTYNRSEYIAFRSAAGASAYFDSLRARFPDYTINVCAHSMGNIVMMQTLNLQLAAGSHSIDNYVLMEAAVPAHCYDTNAPICPGLYTSETPPQTPDAYRGYPGAINAALQGNMYNFYNTNDFALAAWVGNQLLNKPDGRGGYYIVPPLQPYRLLNNPVTDAREIMAFVARPRSFAVGAQPGVQGEIHGAELALAASFGFTDAPADHSGQFTRTIQQVWGFYNALLQKLNGDQP